MSDLENILNVDGNGVLRALMTCEKLSDPGR